VAGVIFGGRELDVMSVLWEEGSATVAEARERLGGSIGYTSVLKILQILEEKGHVRHKVEGRRYRYYPTVRAHAAGRSALTRVVDRIFGGSAELTLARLVADRPISRAERDRMRKILDELEPEEER
jgi:BlaI family penicillinase repressor